jgi:hypothetical protein
MAGDEVTHTSAARARFLAGGRVRRRASGLRLGRKQKQAGWVGWRPM